MQRDIYVEPFHFIWEIPYHHESRWTEKTPRIHQFKGEFARYIGTLKGLKNKKVCEALNIFVSFVDFSV